MMADFIELEPSGKRKRYRLRTPSGVELVIAAARRDLVILFDPDKVDWEITTTGGYRFFSVLTEGKATAAGTSEEHF